MMTRRQAMLMVATGLLMAAVAALAWVTGTPWWLMVLGGVLVVAGLLIPCEE